MTAPPTSHCGSRATADGKAPPRATAAGFSHCSQGIDAARAGCGGVRGKVCLAGSPSLPARTGPPQGCAVPPILPSARSARSRAGYFHARQNRLPRAPLRGAPKGASLTRSGSSRCAPSVFTTDGGYDDHALRPHPGTAGRAAGLPFHASANAPRSRRSWPRLWPNRPRSSATSTAPWRPTAKRKRSAADAREGAGAARAALLKGLAGQVATAWRRKLSCPAYG